MTVDSDIPSSQDLFGKSVDDLQSDIVIGEDKITGTLKYVTDYTGFSGEVTEQSGNYLALHCAVPGFSNATIGVEVVGGTAGEVTLDDDGLIVDRIASNSQSIKVTARATGFDSVIKTYALTDLTLTGG